MSAFLHINELVHGGNLNSKIKRSLFDLLKQVG